MSSELSARDAELLWHPYTQHALEREALPVVGAHGALLELEDGREMIDAISSWWTCLHGHAEPRLIEAMSRQVERLDHVLFAGCTHPPAVELAEALLAVAPPGLARVFYSDNGSTAVEVALKIAYQAWVHRGEPERRVFVALDGAYHGDTFGAMSVGEREPFFSAFEPLLFEVRHAAPEPAALERALTELGPRAAGLILEPRVQGAAGMVMHDDALVRAARELCDRSGVPLIADEVMVGFGRTGSLFASSGAGVAPDLLCLAKGLTGGIFPLSATLATEELFAAFLSEDRRKTFFHGHSFTANAIGCAVAAASLELCLENDVPARLEAIGARIAARIDHPGVRQRGGIVAFELDAPDADAGYLSARSKSVREHAIERGVLLRPLGATLYALPPACTTEAQCDHIAEVMTELAAQPAP